MQTVNAANLKFLIHSCDSAEITDYFDSGVAIISANPSLLAYGLCHWLKEGNKRHLIAFGSYYVPPTGGYMPQWPIV